LFVKVLSISVYSWGLRYFFVNLIFYNNFISHRFIYMFSQKLVKIR